VLRVTIAQNASPQELLDDLHHERRSFLKSAFTAGAGAAAWAAIGTLAAPASAQ
jgi:hypothetical protein